MKHLPLLQILWPHVPCKFDSTSGQYDQKPHGVEGTLFTRSISSSCILHIPNFSPTNSQDSEVTLKHSVFSVSLWHWAYLQECDKGTTNTSIDSYSIIKDNAQVPRKFQQEKS